MHHYNAIIDNNYIHNDNLCINTLKVQLNFIFLFPHIITIRTTRITYDAYQCEAPYKGMTLGSNFRQKNCG